MDNAIGGFGIYDEDINFRIPIVTKKYNSPPPPEKSRVRDDIFIFSFPRTFIVHSRPPGTGMQIIEKDDDAHTRFAKFTSL
jgi:hypothetical protein